MAENARQPERDAGGSPRDGMNCRVRDFLVIPNEQYNRENDEDRPINEEDGLPKRPGEFINNDLNGIILSLDREIGRQWDKKREAFIRRRLMAYLLEDRSQLQSKPSKTDQRKKNEAPREGWLTDAFPITEKQNLVLYGCNSCPRRQLQIKIRVQMLRMLHYLPAVLESAFVSTTPCKALMLEERERIDELTDQVPPIRDQLGLSSEEYTLKHHEVLSCN